jgi:DNA (cytosine-5)-methyltransferase 1
VPERAGQRTAGAGSVVSLVADASDAGRLGWGPSEAGAAGEPSRLESERLRDASRLADAASSRHTRTVSDAEGNPRDEARMLVSSPDYATGRPSPVNDFWRASDWLYCRDGKWRPVEPGTFPLASGVPNRVGRLRGYGNAICVPQAVAFIEAVLDA